MSLLERVGTLLRANLNDLIDRAEDPEKTVRQVVLDMENQLLQVKTQVAIGMADLHLLRKKQEACELEQAEFVRKAELAVAKNNDALARTALERSIDSRRRAESFAQQVTDQVVQVENLKSALHRLNLKLTDAKTKSEILIAKHHRARAAAKAAELSMKIDAGSSSSSFSRLKETANRTEALASAQAELLGSDIESEFRQLEQADEIDKLLAELKRTKA